MGGIIKTEKGYKVESNSRKGTFYDVDLAKPFCTCPAFRFQALRKGGVCKHVQAVREFAATLNQDIYTEIIAFVQDKKVVDSIELIERFGETAVNELLREGQLIEEKGKIRLLL